MNGTAQIFNALSSYGILYVTSMAPWRVYFILCGLMTVTLGIVWPLVVPNSPGQARFLTTEEKTVAVLRLRGQSGGIENKTFKKDQFWEAMSEWKIWAVSGLDDTLPRLMLMLVGFVLAPQQLRQLVDEPKGCHHQVLGFHHQGDFAARMRARCNRDRQYLGHRPSRQVYEVSGRHSGTVYHSPVGVNHSLI